MAINDWGENMKMRYLSTCSWVFALTLVGCFSVKDPKPSTETQKIHKETGCPLVAAHVFTSQKIDISGPEVSNGAYALKFGQLSTDPRAQSILSATAESDLIQHSAECFYRHRDRLSEDQISWYHGLYQYMKTKPSPEQFARYLKSKINEKECMNPDFSTTETFDSGWPGSRTYDKQFGNGHDKILTHKVEVSHRNEKPISFRKYLTNDEKNLAIHAQVREGDVGNQNKNSISVTINICYKN